MAPYVPCRKCSYQRSVSLQAFVLSTPPPTDPTRQMSAMGKWPTYCGSRSSHLTMGVVFRYRASGPDQQKKLEVEHAWGRGRGSSV